MVVVQTTERPVAFALPAQRASAHFEERLMSETTFENQPGPESAGAMSMAATAGPGPQACAGIIARRLAWLRSWEALERFSAAFDGALALLEVRGAWSEPCHEVHCLLAPLRHELDAAMEGLGPVTPGECLGAGVAQAEGVTPGKRAGP